MKVDSSVTALIEQTNIFLIWLVYITITYCGPIVDKSPTSHASNELQ